MLLLFSSQDTEDIRHSRRDPRKYNERRTITTFSKLSVVEIFAFSLGTEHGNENDSNRGQHIILHFFFETSSFVYISVLQLVYDFEIQSLRGTKSGNSNRTTERRCVILSI